MGSPIATNLATILTQIKTNLVTANVFTSSCCWLGLDNDKVDPTPGAPIGVIIPGAQTNDQHKQAGVDRQFLYLAGSFKVVCWNAVALDETTKADSWLTDATLGTLTVATSVINTIHMNQLIDGSSNLLCGESPRLIDWSEFKKVDELHPNNKNRSVLLKNDPPGWGHVDLTFWIGWLQQLS